MYLVAASFKLYFLHDQEEYMLWSRLRLIIVRKTCSGVLDFQANDKLGRENSKINYGNIMKYVKIEFIFQGHCAFQAACTASQILSRDAATVLSLINHAL